MNRGILVLALAAALSAAGVGARGEVSLESAAWQSAKRGPVKAARFEDASEADEKAMLRGLAKVKNRGPKAAETLLLRFAVTARLVKKDAPADAAGAWAVPFLVDETRVAKIPPNQVLSVPLSSPVLELYLKRVARHGLRAAALKLQVMIDPREGLEPAVAESVLELK